MSRQRGAGPAARAVGAKYSRPGYDLRTEAPEENGPVKKYPVIEWAPNLGRCRKGLSVTIRQRGGVSLSKMARGLLQVNPGDHVGVGFDNLQQCAVLRKEAEAGAGFRLSRLGILGRSAEIFPLGRGFDIGTHEGRMEQDMLVIPAPKARSLAPPAGP